LCSWSCLVCLGWGKDKGRDEKQIIAFVGRHPTNGVSKIWVLFCTENRRVMRLMFKAWTVELLPAHQCPFLFMLDNESLNLWLSVLKGSVRRFGRKRLIPDDSSLEFELRFHINSIDDRLPTLHLVNKKINQLFKENHVEISYPQIDVHMKHADQKKRWLVTFRRIPMSPAPKGDELCEWSFWWLSITSLYDETVCRVRSYISDWLR
jgi:potassium efflux system protein